MRKYVVNYSSNVNYSIDIEAESPEEAQRIVEDGEADYGTAVINDETPAMVNNVEELIED